MKKIIIILSVFLAAMVLISGCIDDKKSENPVNGTEIIESDQIPTANLPPGFTLMAVHETEADIGNSSRKAIEGVYRIDGDEIYIQVFNSETPEALIDELKSQYKDVKYDPFTEISINGHDATQVKYYIIKNGTQIPKYNVIWTTKNSLIKVGSSVDSQKVIDLAEAIKS
ncbi:MAG TPA: hypothetical protein VKL21_11530 [Candidatus Methanoperedens sp.]|nr:hypothetical protein [Candidatus Methanoperedens sp.]